jgi:hypothetical protein
MVRSYFFEDISNKIVKWLYLSQIVIFRIHLYLQTN